MLPESVCLHLLSKRSKVFRHKALPPAGKFIEIFFFQREFMAFYRRSSFDPKESGLALKAFLKLARSNSHKAHSADSSLQTKVTFNAQFAVVHKSYGNRTSLNNILNVESVLPARTSLRTCLRAERTRVICAGILSRGRNAKRRVRSSCDSRQSCARLGVQLLCAAADRVWFRGSQLPRFPCSKLSRFQAPWVPRF